MTDIARPRGGLTAGSAAVRVAGDISGLDDVTPTGPYGQHIVRHSPQDDR